MSLGSATGEPHRWKKWWHLACDRFHYLKPEAIYFCPCNNSLKELCHSLEKPEDTSWREFAWQESLEGPMGLVPGVTVQIVALPNIGVNLEGSTALCVPWTQGSSSECAFPLQLLSTGYDQHGSCYLVLKELLWRILFSRLKSMLELFSRELWEWGTSCKVDVYGGCEGFPRDLHEGCLPPYHNYKDEGLCWHFRAHLPHKRMHGLSELALTRNNIFKREEYIWGKGVIEKNYQLFHSATQYFFSVLLLLQQVGTHSVQITVGFSWTWCSQVVHTALYRLDVLLLRPELIRKKSQ